MLFELLTARGKIFVKWAKWHTKDIGLKTMKSRYTNVKYHCEISQYFSVHCLKHSLRNYKEEAEIKPSENALAMPGQ